MFISTRQQMRGVCAGPPGDTAALETWLRPSTSTAAKRLLLLQHPPAVPVPHVESAEARTHEWKDGSSIDRKIGGRCMRCLCAQAVDPHITPPCSTYVTEPTWTLLSSGAGIREADTGSASFRACGLGSQELVLGMNSIRCVVFCPARSMAPAEQVCLCCQQSDVPVISTNIEHRGCVCCRRHMTVVCTIRDGRLVLELPSLEPS
jgi:hypothetical protein